MILKLTQKLKQNLDFLKLKLDTNIYLLSDVLLSTENSPIVPATPHNTPVEPQSYALDVDSLTTRLEEISSSQASDTSSVNSPAATDSLVNSSSGTGTAATDSSVNSLSQASDTSSVNTSIQESFNDLTIGGPLDQFNVTELVGLKFEILGKFYLAITNISLYLALVLAVIIAIFYFGDNDSKLVPNKWSIVLETFFASIKGMVKDQIGLAYEVYLPLIFSIFFFFLTGNLISNIPYSFATNASAVVSIGYSLTFFIGVTITSLFNHGSKFFRNFIPQGTPLALVPLLVAIEFTSYTARGFSLGVRMFANLFSGHCLLAILSVFGTQLLGINWQTAGLTVIFALPIFLAIIGLEVAVSFIQTFVLSLLSCSYVRESIVLH
jgi:F-type H+-transporting ATPase subunit a